MNDAHAAVRAEELLTSEERALVLGLCARLYPRLRGAGVADILDILWDHDQFLDYLEPFYEKNDPYWNPNRDQVLSYLSIAALLLVLASPMQTASAEFGGDLDKIVQQRMERKAYELKGRYIG